MPVKRAADGLEWKTTGVLLQLCEVCGQVVSRTSERLSGSQVNSSEESAKGQLEPTQSVLPRVLRAPVKDESIVLITVRHSEKPCQKRGPVDGRDHIKGHGLRRARVKESSAQQTFLLPRYHVARARRISKRVLLLEQLLILEGELP